MLSIPLPADVFYVLTLRLKLNIRVLANMFLEKRSTDYNYVCVIRFVVVLFFQTISVRYFLNMMFCNLSYSTS
jgi:hypothetical protein